MSSSTGVGWGRTHCVGLFAAVLIVVHTLFALVAVNQKSVTFDEIVHVTGGYLFDRFNDFRIHTDNGVLPQRWHALPAAIGGAKPPPMEGNEYWRTSDAFVVAHQFFYESGNDHWRWLMAARAMNMVFSIALCLLVFFWARRAAGDVAGIVALALAAFSPTLLAHGPLATTDVAAALWLTASVGAFWKQLQSPTFANLAVSTMCFGCACVSKYSAVLLIPVFGLMIGFHIAVNDWKKLRLGSIVFAVLAHALVAFTLIWACFSFRFSAYSADVPAAAHLIRPWPEVLGKAGWQENVIEFLRDHRILPEGFLFGYIHTYVGSLARMAFLAGEISAAGWRTFFPLAFAWKSTPFELAGLLLVVATGTLFALRRRLGVRHGASLAALAIFSAVYVLVAINSRLNIGHRHLLPIYPALFIGTGVAIAKVFSTPRARGIVAALFVVGPLGVAVTQFPHYLAYFNSAAGGASNGWRLLVDSSLDWGQDLPALKQWLDTHNRGPDASRVFLAYFGSGEPEYYGIHAERLPFFNVFKMPVRSADPAPGLYCVSATMLQLVYSPAHGPWTMEYEQRYQRLRSSAPLIRATTRATGNDSGTALLDEFDQLRFTRLCLYLREKKPIGQPGYSILIYQLGPTELSEVLDAPYSAWQAAIARTSPSR